jgi:hypothetical protein
MAVFLIRATSPETVHLVGEPGEPVFENGYTNLNPGSFQEAGFYKDPFGIVHLVGDMVAPGGSLIAFTLPAGYRPDRFQRFAMQGNGDGNTTTLRVDLTGGVHFFNVNVGTTVTLNGVTFRTSND